MVHQVSAVLDYMRIQYGTSSQRSPGLYEYSIWYIKLAQSWTMRIKNGTLITVRLREIEILFIVQYIFMVSKKN